GGGGGGRRDDAGGKKRRALHALPAGAPRRGSLRRRDRRRPERGVGGSGEPAAHAKGPHGVSTAGKSQDPGRPVVHLKPIYYSPMNEVKKVVLAYSGGLDTSVILKWLQETYGCEVVTFTADIGQGEERAPARSKAKLMGVKRIFIEDLREEFVRDFVFPMFRANALYEGEYLLGTSIARPLIAKRLVEIASKTEADAISHGATGKGNDQV